MTKHVSPDWDKAISAYVTELRATGRPASTVGLRRAQLEYLARGLDVPLQQVTRDMLIGFLAAGRWAAETRRSYRSALRMFFGWAAEGNWIEADPAARLPVVKASQGLPRPVPEHVYAAALAGASPRVALMLRCAGDAGLRRGEIARLHSDDVLAGADGFSLLVHGKGGKDRVIPIGDKLADALRAARGWVFASRQGGPLGARWVGQVCGRVLPSPWTLHSLRHRMATRTYSACRDLRAVQILLGHTSPAITQRYIAVSDADLRAAINAAVNQEGTL